MSKLTKSDKPLFVSLMSSAFAQDPLFLHLFGDSERDSKARSHATAFVSFMFEKSFLLHEEVWGYFENERLLGAYVVEKPHANMLRTLKGVLLPGRLILLLFQTSGKTLNLLKSYISVTRSAAPPFPHHYLIMIGVKPEEQGKEIGKALLKHLLDAVNKAKKSQGVALDTENERNINWYRNLGFTLSKETQIGQLPVYCMFYQKQQLLR
ncbi:GNAT family N-acetyltransferase [Cohnella sp.]|uniref:GNAT family N-acetyltransferase n=1 Tax=Cohnella sp. TaxID=1883426 RepID=UPI0035672475